MTNKEHDQIWYTIIFIIGFIIGLAVGSFIMSLQINSEIRTDQLELKEQVAEIIEDKVVIDSLTQKLIIYIEQLKLEQQELRKLQLELSKGEMK